jgi:hypothetical protein
MRFFDRQLVRDFSAIVGSRVHHVGLTGLSVIEEEGHEHGDQPGDAGQRPAQALWQGHCRANPRPGLKLCLS